MENIIASLIQKFEEGKISRRELIRSIAVTASAVSSVPAYAAGEPGIKAVGIKHISYRAADYAKTRDFYSGLLGMKVLADTATGASLPGGGVGRCNLSVGGVDIIVRTAGPGMKPPLVDHICYSIADYNKNQVFALLKQRGLDPQPGKEDPTDITIKDPDGFNVQLRDSRNIASIGDPKSSSRRQ
jgi:catechol 2,3-dioxygenase-like lactoylglutathione lyase family enzyme